MFDANGNQLVVSGARWILFTPDRAAHGTLSDLAAPPAELQAELKRLRPLSRLNVWLGARWCPVVRCAERSLDALSREALQQALDAMAKAQAGVAVPAGTRFLFEKAANASGTTSYALVDERYLKALKALCGWRVRLSRVSPLWLAMSDDGMSMLEETDALTVVTSTTTQRSVTTRCHAPEQVATARERYLMGAASPVRHVRLCADAASIPELFTIETVPAGLA